MQEKKSNIIIFSRPIRSGKTTELGRFIAGRKDVGGFLTPDADGKRRLYDIAAGSYHEFEIKESPILQPAITIGKFHFAISAFDKAKQLFSHQSRYKLFIVDEVGKLEVIHNSGFEPELTLLINHYRSHQGQGMLLLIVRDTLLNAVLNKYNLDCVQIVSSTGQL
jgi:nucleoside-triphosphatase THEP1